MTPNFTVAMRKFFNSTTSEIEGAGRGMRYLHHGLPNSDFHVGGRYRRNVNPKNEQRAKRQAGPTDAPCVDRGISKYESNQWCLLFFFNPRSTKVSPGMLK